MLSCDKREMNVYDRECFFLKGYRRLFVIGILFLFSILTACSDPGNQENPVSTGVLDDDDFNAAVFYYDFSDAYVASVRSILNNMLVKSQITYTEFDAGSSQSMQNSQIEAAISGNAKLLIVNLVDAGSSDASDAICLKASRRGIPVIFFNRSVEADGDEGVVLNYYDDVAFVGTNPSEAGHLQGKMIGEFLVEHFEDTDLNHDGSISYTLFKGEARNAESIYRTKYAVEDANAILEKAGFEKLEYFDAKSVDKYQLDLTGKWSLDSAKSYMMSNLSMFNADNKNMIELVISNNDYMALGAIEALQAVGYNLPNDTESRVIPVFGVDAIDLAKKLIEHGVMSGTVVQDAEGMAKCIDSIANNIQEGRDMLDGTQDYMYDEVHGLHNKLYIPYAIYDSGQ